MKKRVFVVSEMSVIANNMNEAENIYRSMHACMDNYERCKNENENKVSDSNTEYEKRFAEWIKNLHPQKTAKKAVYNDSTNKASDWKNAWNEYVKTLNESDSDYDKQVLANDILSRIEKPYEIPYTKYERKNLSFPLPNMEDVRNVRIAQNYKKALCEYIAKNNIHVHIAKGIIKNMGSNPMNTCNQACLDMVNNRFNDELFKDITQELYIELFNMVMNDIVTISNDGKLEFSDYENNKGETKSYFMKLFSLIQNVLVRNRSVNYARTEKTLDDCTNCKNIIDFVQSDDLANILSSDNFKSFIHYISVKDSKNFSDYIVVISGLLNGRTYKDINGMSERRVKYLKSKLERLHSEYYGSVTTKTVSFHKFETKTMYNEYGMPIYTSVPKKDKNGNIKTYSYEYHYYKGINWNKKYQNA